MHAHAHNTTGLDDNDAQPASWGVRAPLLTPFEAGSGSPPPPRMIEDTGSGLSSIAVGDAGGGLLEERYRGEHRSLAPPPSPPEQASTPAGNGRQ
jgi:hypothetical protein